MASKLSEAVEELKKAIVDFSSLSVTTYTGDLQVIFTQAQRDVGDPPAQPSNDDMSLSNMDLDKLFKVAMSNTDPQIGGKIKLHALNLHKIDGDAIVYRHEEANEALESAHTAALTAGRETREGFLNLVKGFLD